MVRESCLVDKAAHRWLQNKKLAKQRRITIRNKVCLDTFNSWETIAFRMAIMIDNYYKDYKSLTP